MDVVGKSEALLCVDGVGISHSLAHTTWVSTLTSTLKRLKIQVAQQQAATCSPAKLGEWHSNRLTHAALLHLTHAAPL